jgi:hypothetical protein
MVELETGKRIIHVDDESMYDQNFNDYFNLGVSTVYKKVLGERRFFKTTEAAKEELDKPNNLYDLMLLDCKLYGEGDGGQRFLIQRIFEGLTVPPTIFLTNYWLADVMAAAKKIIECYPEEDKPKLYENLRTAVFDGLVVGVAVKDSLLYPIENIFKFLGRGVPFSVANDSADTIDRRLALLRSLGIAREGDEQILTEKRLLPKVKKNEENKD